MNNLFDLSGKVNAQMADNAKQFTDTTQSLSTISRKIVHKISATEYNIVSKKPSKQGFTVMKFQRDVGTVSDSSNQGGNKQLLRLTNVLDGSNALLYMQPTTYTSTQLKTAGTNDFQEQWFATDYSYPTQSTFISNVNRGATNSYFEFTVNIKRSHVGKLYLGFLATSSTCNALGVSINGTNLTTIDTSNTTNMAKIIPIDVSAYSGQVTIRLTVPNTSFVHFLGYNVHDITDMNENLDYNRGMYNIGTTHYISAGNGANEYALQEYGGKWCGSYHGGETVLSLSILVDGVEQSGLGVGRVLAGKKIEIIQSTNIIDKITTYSIAKIYADSVYDFNGYFNIPTPFDIQNFYPCMTCSNPEFSNLLYPIKAIANTGDVMLPNVMKVIQQNPTTGQTITSIFNSMKKYDADNPVWTHYSAGVYVKVYHGQTISKLSTLASIGFGNTKIFD